MIITDSKETVKKIGDFLTNIKYINNIQREIIKLTEKGIEVKTKWERRGTIENKMVERVIKARIGREDQGQAVSIVRKKERQDFVSGELIRLWQEEWESESTGRWTYEWLPQVGWGGLPCSHRLAQLVTGHGNFAASLRRFGIREGRSECECGEGQETARHLALDCTLIRCREERERYRNIF